MNAYIPQNHPFESQVKATSVKKKAPCPRPILLYVFLGGIGEVPLDFHTDIPTWRKCTKENIDNMQVQDNKYPYEKI